MNSHSEVIYKLMYGDKDTFRLAFALAGKSSSFEQARCGLAPRHALCKLVQGVSNSVPAMLGVVRESISFQQMSVIPM